MLRNAKLAKLFFISILIFIITITSSALAKDPNRRGHCKILNAGEPFASNKCQNGYAIVYRFNKGLSMSTIPFSQYKLAYDPTDFLSDYPYDDFATRLAKRALFTWDATNPNPCYKKLQDAQKALASVQFSFCDNTLAYRHCFILNSSQKAMYGKKNYCKIPSSPFVIIHGKDRIDDHCYSDLSDAVNKMINPKENACSLSSRRGPCQILNRQEMDKKHFHFDESFAILFKGRILDNQPYKTMNEALREMHSNEICAPTLAPKSTPTSRPKAKRPLPVQPPPAPEKPQPIKLEF